MLCFNCREYSVRNIIVIDNWFVDGHWMIVAMIYGYILNGDASAGVQLGTVRDIETLRTLSTSIVMS